MPLREGKMECSTCHNPHGSTNVKLLRKGDSVAEMCTSCHADKRGPYLWEHAPTRDGCTTCHDPHGSSNERMLVAQAADPLPALPRRDAPPEHDLRRRADRIGADPERAHLRAVVRDVPLEHPRVEPPQRSALHPVRRASCACHAFSRSPSSADSGDRVGAVRRTSGCAGGQCTEPAGQPPAPAADAAAAGRGGGQHRMGRLHRFRRARHRSSTATRRASSAIATSATGCSSRPSASTAKRKGWLSTFAGDHVGRRDQRLRRDRDPARPVHRHRSSGIRSRCSSAAPPGRCTRESAPACSASTMRSRRRCRRRLRRLRRSSRSSAGSSRPGPAGTSPTAAWSTVATEALTFSDQLPAHESRGHDPVRRQLRPQQPGRASGADPAHAVRCRRRRPSTSRDPLLLRGGLHRIVVPQRRDLGDLRQSLPRDRHRRDAVAGPSDAAAEQLIHRRQRHGVGEAARTGRGPRPTRRSACSRTPGDPLVPQTINTAIATAPLDRQTVDGEARTSAVNLRFTSQADALRRI